MKIILISGGIWRMIPTNLKLRGKHYLKAFRNSNQSGLFQRLFQKCSYSLHGAWRSIWFGPPPTSFAICFARRWVCWGEPELSSSDVVVSPARRNIMMKHWRVFMIIVIISRFPACAGRWWPGRRRWSAWKIGVAVRGAATQTFFTFHVTFVKFYVYNVT